MAYTEIKEINGKKYYYRVRSVREGKKFKKKRIYLGKEPLKEELSLKEEKADKKLNIGKKSKALDKLIPKIRRILKKNKIKRAGIFGSYVRGEEKKGSDIDIIIKPAKDMSLLGFVGVKLELEDSLGRKIDLVSYKAIHPLLKKRILNGEVRII